MRHVALTLVALTMFAGAARAADDVAACVARQAAAAKQAASYQGDAKIKRLIDADLRRALKELQDEGDVEECNEAVDHATKLLAGEF
jgi:hypothetical protein